MARETFLFKDEVGVLGNVLLRSVGDTLTAIDVKKTRQIYVRCFIVSLLRVISFMGYQLQEITACGQPASLMTDTYSYFRISILRVAVKSSAVSV